MLVLDDLHWAEPPLLDLVEHICDWSRGVPIFLLCIARPELLDVRPGWAGGKLNATSLLLEPLDDGDTAELVDRLLDGVELDPATRARIVETAEGNPLFLEEMAALAREAGGGVEVPPTIHALLQARLDTLGAEERTVIERGAVEGKVFHRGAVTALAPEPQRDDVPSRLLSLVRKELVRPDRTQIAGDDAFRFRHLLIRDTAYESLPKAARADLHEAVRGLARGEREPLRAGRDPRLPPRAGGALPRRARRATTRAPPRLAERAGGRLAARGGRRSSARTSTRPARCSNGRSSSSRTARSGGASTRTFSTCSSRAARRRSPTTLEELAARRRGRPGARGRRFVSCRTRTASDVAGGARAARRGPAGARDGPATTIGVVFCERRSRVPLLGRLPGRADVRALSARVRPARGARTAARSGAGSSAFVMFTLSAKRSPRRESCRARRARGRDGRSGADRRRRPSGAWRARLDYDAGDRSSSPTIRTALEEEIALLEQTGATLQARDGGELPPKRRPVSRVGHGGARARPTGRRPSRRCASGPMYARERPRRTGPCHSASSAIPRRRCARSSGRGRSRSRGTSPTQIVLDVSRGVGAGARSATPSARTALLARARGVCSGNRHAR